MWKSSTELSHKYELAFPTSLAGFGMARYSIKRVNMESATGLSTTKTFNLRLQSRVRLVGSCVSMGAFIFLNL